MIGVRVSVPSLDCCERDNVRSFTSAPTSLLYSSELLELEEWLKSTHFWRQQRAVCAKFYEKKVISKSLRSVILCLNKIRIIRIQDSLADSWFYTSTVHRPLQLILFWFLSYQLPAKFMARIISEVEVNLMYPLICYLTLIRRSRFNRCLHSIWDISKYFAGAKTHLLSSHIDSVGKNLILLDTFYSLQISPFRCLWRKPRTKQPL